MTHADLVEHLLGLLREVQHRLTGESSATAAMPFGEAVDSMGFVEFVGAIADDCAVSPEEVERAAELKFTNVGDLARAMQAAGILPGSRTCDENERKVQQLKPSVWLTRWVAVKGWPEPTVELDQRLDRPRGWVKQHAGIVERSCWWEDDPLNEIAKAVGQYATSDRPLAALLMTGEAPARPLAQAAALHARLDLPANIPALDVGGACVGFLHCLWLANRLVRPGEDVLVVALEAPSRWLTIASGPEGEAAALFGDGAAACLCSASSRPWSLALRDIVLGCDGSANLIEIDMPPSPPAVRMDGSALALRAVQQLADAIRDICNRNSVSVADLATIYVHAGNGRMPHLLARRLDVPEDAIVSTTSTTGNLGSVSLPAALASKSPTRGPIAMATVGAGLHWGAALFDLVIDTPTKGPP